MGRSDLGAILGDVPDRVCSTNGGGEVCSRVSVTQADDIVGAGDNQDVRREGPILS